MSPWFFNINLKSLLGLVMKAKEFRHIKNYMGYNLISIPEALVLSSWLSKDGEAVLVDAGRKVNVFKWQMAIGIHLLKKLGIKKTFQVLKEGKEVSKQNALIRKMQDDGRFWTHTHNEFIDAVSASCMSVLKSFVTFRGVSDFVVAKKLKS